MKFFKKLASSLTVGAILLSTLSGCSGSGNTPAETTPPPQTGNQSQATPPPSDTSNEGDNATSENPVVFRLTGSSIPNLSPHQYLLDSVRVVLTWTTGSLYSIIYDEDTDNLKFYSVMAEEFPETNDGGITWTYKIRDGLTFTNGNPITAETFEYSWKMLLDPNLVSPQAGSLYSSVPVKNAEAYYLGMSEEDYQAKRNDPDADWAVIEKSDNPVQWEDVGIKALDAHTLVITLESEFTQTDMVYNFSTSGSLAPVDPEMYEACMNADRTENTYGTTLETLAQSGPYTLVGWAKDQHRVYEKNPNSPLASIYTPDVIEEIIVSDANAAVQLFEAGAIDGLAPAGTNAEAYLEDPRALRAEGPVVWGYYINTLSETNPILQDNDFRKAIFYATDRESIAKDVYKVYIPADYFVSRRAVVGDILSGAQRYRDTPQGIANTGDNFSFDPAIAKDYFDKAYEANGSNKISVSLTYFDTSESQKRCAEVLKEDYEEYFGADRFELVLQAVPVEAAYDSYMNRSFDMGFGTMGQDSFNPWASLEIWSTVSSEKADTFYNTEYDSLQRRSATGDLVTNPAGRLDALGRMEELLLDYMPWIPIYQNDGIIVYSDRVTIKPSRYITSIAYAPWQADITNDVPRSILVD